MSAKQDNDSRDESRYRNDDRVLGPIATLVSVGLIAGFMALVVVMIVLRSDSSWERLIYVFSGYEALVFAGAGALFGTTVQRQTVSSARREAAESSARARESERDANAGRALAQVVRAKRAAESASKAKKTGMRSLDSQPNADMDLDELTAIVDQLFGNSD